MRLGKPDSMMPQRELGVVGGSKECGCEDASSRLGACYVGGGTD